MILEVNNTFDERHMYLLRPAADLTGTTPSVKGGAEPSNSPEPSFDGVVSDAIADLGKSTRFVNSWPKEFHVSPFNSRKGAYSLVAYDPLFPSMSGQGGVNNTITLQSSKAHSKLVARIFSQGRPLDPTTMNAWQKFKFLASWWWVGFITFPRIVREAGKLFFKRKLHVWFRPEPSNTSIGRNADSTEQFLEASFRNYLRYLVKSAKSPLIVKYKAAGISDSQEESMRSDVVSNDPSASNTLEFKVLTPVFYSRFVHYAHDLEALCSEFSDSETIWLSQPSLLPQLVLKKPLPPQLLASWTDYIFFKSIQKFRQRPSPIDNPKTSSSGKGPENVIKGTKSDIRTFRLSGMDGYVLAQGTKAEQKIYRAQVLKVFISNYVALGNIDILRAEVFVLKCIVAWAMAGYIMMT
jgi:hypothetical protein